MKLIGALTQAGAKAAKTAPFYSAVDEALANLKRNKGTGAEFFSELKNTKNIKPSELADRKLEQAFKAKGKMTKQEAQQVLADNPPPNIQERVLQDLTDKERQEMIDDNMMRYGYDRYNEVPRERMTQWHEEIDADAVKYNDPDYVSKGGSNYREILLKLPQESAKAKQAEQNLKLAQSKYEADPTQQNYARMQMAELELDVAKTTQGGYRSSHWDDPNVLAHIRVQDRMIPQPPQKGFYVVNNTSGRQSAMFDTPEELQAYVQTLPESIRNNVTMAQGERKVPPRKVLQVEEIQSDWHQEGRKKGYAKPETKRLKGTVEEQTSEFGFAPEYKVTWEDGTFSGGYGSREQAQARAVEGKSDAVEGIPDAPFKKNWHELAMKRLLNYAADNGYDSIAITPGAEQAKRFDLSKHINTISWNKQSNGLYGIEADTVEGRPIIKKGLTEQELEDTVGKEVANRIVNGVGQFANDPLFDSGKLTRGRLENLDLQVGGEGMMGFYDKILPDYLNNFGKPYGAQVGTFDIANPKPNKGISDLAELLRQRGLTDEQYANLPQQERVQLLNEVKEANASRMIPLHNFPITPQMRESIKQKGLPLYQQIGIPTAGAGAASQMLEPEEESGLATGGSVAKMAALAKLAKLKEEMTPRAEAVKALIARDENKYLRDVTPNSLTNTEIEAEIARMKARAEASQPEVKKADGGAINYNTVPDMTDGERIMQGAPFKRGGKVNMTTNRDTMFLELSNKKLKRK